MTNTSKENHIIVLPEEARMTEAIEAYILKSYRLFHGWWARTIFIHNEWIKIVQANCEIIYLLYIYRDVFCLFPIALTKG